ncbi:MAG TPA: endonuclease III [Sphingomicrobium sp.]
MTRDQVFEFFRRLAEANPSPTTELDYVNPYTLLVAVVLSAQATDASVNIATRPLFEHQRTPQQMVELGEERLREAIKTIGLFNTKAKNVIALSRALIDRHGGKVPRTREELQALPGVGRKTANVVLNTAFGEETFAVDTHVFRVCNRTGLAAGKNVDEVEARLEKVVPQPFRRDAHHWLILHGRYTCKARLPECWRCPVIDLCSYQPKTPPPEERTKSTAARTANRVSSKARTAKAPTGSKPKANHSRSRPSHPR